MVSRATATLPPEIITIGDFPSSISIWVYAASGVGKTQFAGTAPNRLFIAPVREGGIEAALATAGPDAKVWPVREWSDVERAKEWLNKHPDVFEWVIVDSLTHLQDVAMRSWLKIVTKDNKKRDPHIPAIQDYLKVQELLKELVTDLNEEQMFHKLYTAGVQRADVLNPEADEWQNLLLPHVDSRDAKLAMRLCGQMMVIAYYYDHPPSRSRRMLFQPHGHIYAKDRYAALGVFKQDPQVPQLQSLIEKEIARKREAAA